jgi:cyclase
VLGVDSLADEGGYLVKQYTGSEAATRDAGRLTLEWVREACDRGAGEIVLNCMSRDGVRTGYDLSHTSEVVGAVSVPVIASGGAGTPEHFRDAFLQAQVSGALAATVFHDRLIAIPQLKEYLASCGIEMRR